MKYLILLAIIYFVYRFYTITSKMSSLRGNDNQKLKEEDEGEYIDYEEVE